MGKKSKNILLCSSFWMTLLKYCYNILAISFSIPKSKNSYAWWYLGIVGKLIFYPRSKTFRSLMQPANNMMLHIKPHMKNLTNWISTWCRCMSTAWIATWVSSWKPNKGFERESILHITVKTGKDVIMTEPDTKCCRIKLHCIFKTLEQDMSVIL